MGHRTEGWYADSALPGVAPRTGGLRSRVLSQAWAPEHRVLY